MSRQSAEAKSVALAFERPILKAPKSLTVAQAAVWASTVASKPHDWFDGGSIPLLVAYCRDVVEADRIAKLVDDFDTACMSDDDDLRRYKALNQIANRLHKQINSNAVKLRLSPSAHTRADAAQVKAKRKMPWAGGRVVEHDEG